MDCSEITGNRLFSQLLENPHNLYQNLHLKKSDLKLASDSLMVASFVLEDISDDHKNKPESNHLKKTIGKAPWLAQHGQNG